MRQKLGFFLGFLGWDGIAFLLNVCLLSLNLRQHYNFRESPDRYRPIEAEHVHLLSQKEVAELENNDKVSPQNPFPSASSATSSPAASLSSATAIKKTVPVTQATHTTALMPSPSSTPVITSVSPVSSPSGAPRVTTSPPTFPPPLNSTVSSATLTAPHTQTPAKILPAVKIAPSSQLSSANTVAAEPLPLASASKQCRIFGPLTFNRLQQLQTLWKKQNPALSELTWITTQPLHHYSVIFPPLTNAQAENKHNELIRAGLKFHEFWTEGRSHSVIVVGNFEEETKADKLVQELHQKGFRESYMMVRTSPNVYWINHTEAVKHWVDQPSIARAYGVRWKNTQCTASVSATMPISPNNAHLNTPNTFNTPHSPPLNTPLKPLTPSSAHLSIPVNSSQTTTTQSSTSLKN